MAKLTTKVQAKKILPHPGEKKVLQTPLAISDRATKRVIAPFVRIIRKDVKPAEVEEAKQFSFYLQKKPSVLIRDLSSFLSDSVDLPSLLHETSDVLKNVTKAAGVTLYMMDSAANEIYVSRKIPTDERHKIRWKIDRAAIVATYVANQKEYVLVDDILRDDRFPEGIGYDGESIKSVLCVPVVTPNGECFAVIELYRLLFDNPFSIDDLKITVIVTGWMGAAVHQNSQRLALKRQQELNDYLLDLTKCYFGETVSIEKMISEIIKFAKVTLAAERGTFFVIDRDSDESVADMFEEGEEELNKDLGGPYKKATKVRFGKDRGIAGIVARTGVTVNVKDAYNDARFNKEIDQKTGFITRSILCMPILGVDGTLGVIQVVNKKNGGCFTPTDEILFKTFSVYSALALHYTKVYRQMSTTKRLNTCFLKLLQTQQKPCIHDHEYLVNNYKVKLPVDFNQFSWYINPDEHLKMPQYCLYMMLKLIDGSEIDINQTMLYVLTVRKLYRKIPYHNFEHAFAVCHSMFLILKRNSAKFTHIEVKALIVASLCHDVDHPGFTSNFFQLTKDDLSFLYEESTLENHHYYVTMQLLETYQLFPSLTTEEKNLLYKEIKEAILATDILNYYKIQPKMVPICANKIFDWNNQLHRSYIKTVIMVSCDFAGQCKPFLVSKKIVDNLYIELYRQGDVLKEMGYCPISILDREKQHSLPEEQVRFLSVIVLPCLDLLRKVLPSTDNLYKDAEMLRQTWQDIINIRGKKCWRQDDSIVEKVYALNNI